MQEPMIRKLPREYVEKVWGVAKLPAPFDQPSPKRIGEVWFEPPPELDQLLVKFIFTSERLSVQAHPDDKQAQEMGLGRVGKSECWVIVDAEPGATIAVGFKTPITPEQMRASAEDGSIVDLLVWHEVQAGEVFYIPAGMVHAIGGGISLVEVQQNNDITFRLFDYGRPRDLHLDQGVLIADTGIYPGAFRTQITGKNGLLADSPHFRLHVWRSENGAAFPPLNDGPVLFIPFSGEISLDETKLLVGDCVMVRDLSSVVPTGEGVVLIAQPV